jgi:hypothetical protein
VENEALIADLVSWIAKAPKPYAEVMEAWRTSCPRLMIWEDAVDHGFVRRQAGADAVPMVAVTDKGRAFLAACGRKA